MSAIGFGATGQPAARAAASFLRGVFHGQERGVVSLFCNPAKRSFFASLDRNGWHDEAAAIAIRERENQNVYYAIGVQAVSVEKGRGKESGVIALPGLCADVDILGPNHVAHDLPPTIDDAWSIIREVALQPTLVVYTGGGLQLLWLFREPLGITSEKDRRTAKRLSKGFQMLLANIAARNGWAIDSTADLCRLLRVPGTYNRKQASPLLVEYHVIGDGKRYNPSDFEELLQLESDPELRAHVQGVAPENPTAEFWRVLAGCPWLRHCKDDAATLPEPEWYHMLSIVGRCKDGARIAHDLSKSYPKYSEAETTKKLKQAIGASGPTTCAFIESDLGQAHYCSRCNYRGKIKSPVVLGIPKWTRRSQTPDPRTSARLGSLGGNHLPNIQASDRQLRDVSREALAALRFSNNPPSLFVRGGKAVRVIQEEGGRHILEKATDPIIRNHLTRSADFYTS